MLIKLSMPCTGYITQRYGENVEYYKRWGYCCGHNGIDYGIQNGTEIQCTHDGKVVAVAYEAGGYGNYVKVSHNEGAFYTYYAHLQSASVKVGAEVSNQQVIGLSNNTGASTGPHLHFGLKIPGAYAGMNDYVDPAPFMSMNGYEPPANDQEFLIIDIDMEVIVNSLNVRNGAGTNYARVGSVGNGDKLEINALTFFCGNGQEVWVRIASGTYAEKWCAAIYSDERYMKQIFVGGEA